MGPSNLPPFDPNDLATADKIFPPAVNPDDLGRGPLVMGVCWAFSALAIIIVGMRFWLRSFLLKTKLQIEDWLMLVALILNTACVSCLTVAFHHGFGKHDADLFFSNAVNIAKWIWMSFTPGITCSIAARISVAILLIRIFGVHIRLKWFLIAITALQVLASVVLTFCSWFQVRPVQALWNPLIPAQKISPNVVARVGNVAGGLFALGDLAYVFGPVLVVAKLNMPLSRKIGVVILLALSLFTMGCSIAKAVAAESGTQSTDDKQYKSSLALMWSVTEQTFVIMMGCAPTLSSITRVPFVTRFAGSVKSLFSSSGGSWGDGKSSGLGKSGEGYYELGVKGTRKAREQKGSELTTEQETVCSVEEGRVRRTDRLDVEWHERGGV